MTARPALATIAADPGLVAALPVEAVAPALLELHALEGRLLARLNGSADAVLAPARPRRWLRVEEAAAEYGIARKTLYDWIYKRRITSKKLGTKRRDPVLVPRAEIERLTTTRPVLRQSRLDGQ